MPFMTVMIPVYNGERYLADAIGSALSQPCGDLEVLVLDDGSTDGTASVARRATEADPRVRVRSHPNYGLGRNRNDGMPLVRGELLVVPGPRRRARPGLLHRGAARGPCSSLFSAGVEVVVPSRIIARRLPLARGGGPRAARRPPSRGWEGLPRAALRVRDHALLDGAPTPRGHPLQRDAPGDGEHLPPQGPPSARPGSSSTTHSGLPSGGTTRAR